MVSDASWTDLVASCMSSEREDSAMCVLNQSGRLAAGIGRETATLPTRGSSQPMDLFVSWLWIAPLGARLVYCALRLLKTRGSKYRHD